MIQKQSHKSIPEFVKNLAKQINRHNCKKKALDSQIGGSHYKNMPFQPIELIVALRCSFIQGCIIKYISRYKHKNGPQDIEKCIHYAQLAIELGDKRKCNDKTLSESVCRFVADNKLSFLQRKIISQTVYNKYERVIQYCKELLSSEYSIKQL